MARKSPSKFSLEYGDFINGYHVIGVAGRGATCTVYKVRSDDEEGKIYAIKVLDNVQDERKKVRFQREAEMMLSFTHDNVVFCEGIDYFNNQMVVIMEYIDGLQLNKWLEKHWDDLDQRVICCLFLDILRGVAYTHARGIYHRDLKPANVMVTRTPSDDRWIAKIIDFGVARYKNEEIPQEDRESITGTAAYMSPEEICDPDTVCDASDLYSIGIMLYEALCGKRPFEGMPVPKLLNAHVKLDPPPPRKINPEISDLFENIIKRLMAKSLDERYRSVIDVIDALEEAYFHLGEDHDEDDEEGDEVGGGESLVSTTPSTEDHLTPETGDLPRTEITPRSPQEEGGIAASFRRFFALIVSFFATHSQRSLPQGGSHDSSQAEDETLSLDTTFIEIEGTRS